MVVLCESEPADSGDSPFPHRWALHRGNKNKIFTENKVWADIKLKTKFPMGDAQEVLSTDSPPIIPAVRNAKTVFHWQTVTMLIRNFFAKHNFFLGQCPYLWVKFEVSNYCSDFQISMMFIKCQLEKMNERLMSRLQVCFVQIKISNDIQIIWP